MNSEIFKDINTLTKEDAEKEIAFFIRYSDLYASDEVAQKRIKELQNYIVLKKYIKVKPLDDQ